MSMICVEHLTKDYGNQRGVFDLSLQVETGEAYGYLGPNGAGKTTTIRHLLGFLNADSGACSIAGLDCRSQTAQIHAKLGYLPGEIAFFDEMKGLEYLRFLARLRGTRQMPRLQELLNRFELDACGRIRRMSKGMKQKLGLVAALMHDPEVLILDEPTSGLDPLMQSVFVNLIQEEKRRGKTILMSSHSFEEIEKTCDRAGILRQGRLAAQLKVDDLKSRRRRIYSVQLPSVQDKQHFLAEGLEIVGQGERHVDVAVTGELGPFLAALNRHPVSGLDIAHQSLEDVFISYYGGKSA